MPIWSENDLWFWSRNMREFFESWSWKVREFSNHVFLETLFFHYFGRPDLLSKVRDELDLKIKFKCNNAILRYMQFYLKRHRTLKHLWKQQITLFFSIRIPIHFKYKAKSKNNKQCRYKILVVGVGVGLVCSLILEKYVNLTHTYV